MMRRNPSPDWIADAVLLAVAALFALMVFGAPR